MEIEKFMEKIGLNSLAKNIINNFNMTHEEYCKYKKLFDCNYLAFNDKVKTQANYRQLFLYLFTRFAVDCHAEYLAKAISDKIYFDTFRDIAIWCDICYRDYGEYGIEEYRWLYKHPKLKIFALGRLQFELINSPFEVLIGNKLVYKDEIVFNVHIPKGEPLDILQCKKSFTMAKDFFRGAANVFFCFSWLLSSGLKSILPHDSNIIKFQNLFNIIKDCDDFGGGERFIFETIDKNIANFPEKTLLQREIKHRMLSGERFFAAVGALTM